MGLFGGGLATASNPDELLKAAKAITKSPPVKIKHSRPWIQSFIPKLPEIKIKNRVKNLLRKIRGEYTKKEIIDRSYFVNDELLKKDMIHGMAEIDSLKSISNEFKNRMKEELIVVAQYEKLQLSSARLLLEELERETLDNEDCQMGGYGEEKAVW